MRSYSRNRESERGRSGSRKDENRSRSGDNSSRDFNRCIGCKCEDCVKMRENAKEINNHYSEGYAMNEEFLVNYTEKGKQVMILDIGAPVSLAGKEWMMQYFGERDLEIKDMK